MRSLQLTLAPLLPLLILLTLVNPTAAQSAPVSASASASTSAPPTAATIVSGAGRYAYYGCYNETTGIAGSTGGRALGGGADEVLPGAMTVELCVAFCGSANGTAWTYAGLEYSRECWCADFVSGLSAAFPNSSCNLACDGNQTEICGGDLKLSVYKLNGASSARVASAALALAVGAVTLAALGFL